MNEDASLYERFAEVPSSTDSGPGGAGTLQPESLQPESLQPESLNPESLQPETLQPERLA